MTTLYSNWKCATDDVNPAWTQGYACFSRLSAGSEFTGLWQVNNSPAVETTTSLAATQSIDGWAYGVRIRWQSTDLAAVTSAPTTTASTNTTSSSSSSTNTQTPIPSSGGLSTGAQAGIGVGVSVGTLAILGMLVLLWMRRRRDPGNHPPTNIEIPGGGIPELENKPAASAPYPTAAELAHSQRVLQDPVELGASDSHGAVELPT
jgi:hypothetical protein